MLGNAAAQALQIALMERFEQRLAEDLGIAGEGNFALAIEDAFHRRLPVQREQLIKSIRAASAQKSTPPAG